MLGAANAGCDAPTSRPSPPAASKPPSSATPTLSPGDTSGSASAAAIPSGTGAPGAAAIPSAATVEPTSVAAQHVLVAYKGADGAPKGVARSKVDAKKRADEVLAKAKAGTDFTALVSEYSDDPAAKERAGSVGKFTRDKMVKPFSDAAFALPVGGVSDPVETKYGFHVIKRNQ